ncbi:hypothetical protein DID77_04505 [Candidatus Marinamargulisbacteria bacterium SCGC AG-439-L15]|nr:hypothetical protein DID77_04505 [Candidatus Marinamargulisbacteria bacterium SCGC AG-439-L15]
MKPVVIYSIGIVVFGIVITSIVRGIFRYLNRKEESAFMKDVNGKIEVLNKQIEQRSGDLQEVMDMIQKEYSDALKESPPQEVENKDAPKKEKAKKEKSEKEKSEKEKSEKEKGAS